MHKRKYRIARRHLHGLLEAVACSVRIALGLQAIAALNLMLKCLALVYRPKARVPPNLGDGRERHRAALDLQSAASMKTSVSSGRFAQRTSAWRQREAVRAKRRHSFNAVVSTSRFNATYQQPRFAKH